MIKRNETDWGDIRIKKSTIKILNLIKAKEEVKTYDAVIKDLIKQRNTKK